MSLRATLFIWLASFLLLCPCVRAEEDPAPSKRPAPNRASSVSAWKMETLRRKDGKRFFGLVQSNTADGVRFVEVKRPPGKRWYLVVHSYAARSVASISRLDANDREQLVSRIGPLLKQKSHARIEAGRMEDVRLHVVLKDGGKRFRYKGVWFDLLSSADEATTRRCVVRIEQIFRAYAQVIPRRHRREDKLQIVMHGSMDEYRRDLHQRDLQIQNPAFYSIKENLIIAGSELSRYAERLDEIQAENSEVRRDLAEMDAGFTTRMRDLRDQLQRNGFSKSDITSEMQIRRAKWRVDERKSGFYWDKIREINAIERRNHRRFNDVTDAMFRRLYHEAFHAYLENHVYPNDRANVPRWLNEGLAQIFENSQLDDDTLRIDAPGDNLLKRLQSDLKEGRQLALRDLLTKQEEAYVLTHDSNFASKQHYLYSWGLAYYLTFKRDFLGGEALDDYIAASQSTTDPVVRFEKLIGSPLDEFQREWRNYMLALKSNGDEK